MKNYIIAFVLTSLFQLPCFAQSKNIKDQVQASMDLNIVVDDKVMVTVVPPKINDNKVMFRFPKIVPGTYSEDDYGQFIDNFKALDKKGKELPITKIDENSFEISKAKSLVKVTYWVNDTFDIENKHHIFSPAGTNILAGKNFLVNMHGFVGYFTNMDNLPYTLTIDHPSTLWGATSLVDTDTSDKRDVFHVNRYADLVDSPVMYSEPDYVTFKIDDMDILISVYSANKTVSAEALKEPMMKMMRAQKNVVSHEFFHIVTPLSIHSDEIQNFNFNEPKMSEHLWMYEGVTEYFANLFQVQQGLIDESEFLNRMSEKILNASKLNDSMSFTEMSKNVLEEPYKSQYLNVYEKGTLIGMCIDIIIREKSDGKRGILDLMQKLSVIYGPKKPFSDDELFAKITELTYPEVGVFLQEHVKGTTPINYNEYFAKMGIGEATTQVPANVFLKDQTPYITIVPATKEITIIPGIELSKFLSELGLKGGDVISEVNGNPYNLDNIYELIMGSQDWKEGDNITMKIKRDGKAKDIKGKVFLTYEDRKGLMSIDTSKAALKNAWLKG